MGRQAIKSGRLVAAFIVLAWAAAAGEGSAQPAVELETLAGGLTSPVAVTHAGDGRLFITQQDGLILVWDGSRILAQPFLDLRPVVGFLGERGLFSVAFHPAYAGNGFFFVNYTDVGGDTVIARYRATNPAGNRADAGSGVVLMTLAQPFGNHNGGQLQFGPDGFLYIGMGDGGSGNDPLCAGQRDDTLLGKMLRLDVDQSVGSPPYHGIPQSNPFAGPGDPPDEVWARGLRNPWRFSFDRLTGDLFIADVGQSAREEISFQPAASLGGENYGWKIMEGTQCTGGSAGCPPGIPPCGSPGLVAPILEYANGGGNCAVVGGHRYRGEAIPDLGGRYLYGDFCSGRIWAARRQGNVWIAEQLAISVPGLTAFGEGVDGEIYLTAQGGSLFKLVGPPPAPPSEPGILELTTAALEIGEGGLTATLAVRRRGGSDGEVGVSYATLEGSASAGTDYASTAGTLSWPDGDAADKIITVEILDDGRIEPSEAFALSLTGPTGGAVLGAATAATVEILDDDLPPGPCAAGLPSVLCLQDGRFHLEIDWSDSQGGSGLGQAGTLTEDTGFFWFFDQNNVEVVVKVLDACGPPFDRFWVFAGGLTNVETVLTVADTASGEVRQYRNPQQTAFQPLQDTNAFATCP